MKKGYRKADMEVEAAYNGGEKYPETCDGCHFSSICKYSEHYNFCDECKYYPDCPIAYGNECIKGRNIECNNGFEPKSLFDDDEDEEVDEEVDE